MVSSAVTIASVVDCEGFSVANPGSFCPELVTGWKLGPTGAKSSVILYHPLDSVPLSDLNLAYKGKPSDSREGWGIARVKHTKNIRRDPFFCGMVFENAGTTGAVLVEYCSTGWNEVLMPESHL